MRGALLVEEGIKEKFCLIRNLQDADGQETVSDGRRQEAWSDKDKGEKLEEIYSWSTSALLTPHPNNPCLSLFALAGPLKMLLSSSY